MSEPLIIKHGGYRRLHAFTFATMIHLETIRFCKRFISYRDDSLGKTVGQMVGAARSGRQNIIEGSERAGTSAETEIKLTDVARASLGELLGDYEMFLADRGAIPWSRHEAEREQLAALRLREFKHSNDALHAYWVYFHEERKAFAPWLDHKDPTVVANALLVLIVRTMAMLEAQTRKLGTQFLKDGGFRERMYQQRSASREEATPPDPDAPTCPDCEKLMRKRTSGKGPHAGDPFWGCSGFPSCRGTRPFEKKETRTR
jgi:restriction system protein